MLFKLVTKSAAEFLEEIAIKTIDTSQSSKLEVVKSSIEIEQKKLPSKIVVLCRTPEE